MNQEESRNVTEPAGAESAGAEPVGTEPADTEPASPAAETTGSIERRDILKALAGIPILGVFFWRALRKKGIDDFKKQQILAELGDIEPAPAVIPQMRHAAGERIRLGIIGFGGEGQWLTECAGFVTPDRIEEKRKWDREHRDGTSYRDFINQTDLNIRITAICDVFDVRAENALAAAKNDERPGGGSGLEDAKRYHHYQDLLAAGDVDAVIIATPDHWHSRMAIDAVRAGKPVYLEKCMTRTEQEALDLHRAVKETGMAFQLGHQNRQVEANDKAREIIQRGILGPINLVETTTNRNSPGGAWVYDIHEEGSPATIDWDLFQEAAPHKVPFSLDRFFRWRCWFDYGTGLSGDLFSHEYDTINQILEIGIPETVTASGGIYFYDDEKFFDYFDREEFPVNEKRDVPDIFHITCEYPDRNMTLLYSATLSNGRPRGIVLMGHDASMEVGNRLTVTADGESTRFREKIENRIIDTSLPLFTYSPGQEKIDAITSASDQYFLTRGLMYTYRGGQRFPTNHLHIAEWLDVIRNGGETSCNIDRGLEEAITCHMATTSYLEGRRVRWDPRRRRIV